jgi:hypothetical protein
MTTTVLAAAMSRSTIPSRRSMSAGPRSGNSQRRSDGMAKCDVSVVGATRRLSVRAARALTRDRGSVRRVCRDLRVHTVGLYGVVTAPVTKRVREIGIRMSFGARIIVSCFEVSCLPYRTDIHVTCLYKVSY